MPESSVVSFARSYVIFSLRYIYSIMRNKAADLLVNLPSSSVEVAIWLKIIFLK